MTVSFSTTHPMTTEVSHKHLEAFVESCKTASDEEVSKVDRNIKTLFGSISSMMLNEGFNSPLRVQVFLEKEGDIGALIFTTREAIKGLFKDASGNYKLMPRSKGDPMQEVSNKYKAQEPDIDIAIRGETIGFTMKTQTPGSYQDLFEQTFLADFITAKEAPMDSTMGVLGNVFERDEKSPGAKKIHETAQGILSAART